MTEETLETRITRLEERLAAKETATQLQAKEYERRLTDLNHAHEQAQEKNAEYLPRETWEAAVEQWNDWRSGVNRDLARLPEPNEMNRRLSTLETTAAENRGAILEARRRAATVALGVAVLAVAAPLLLRLIAGGN